MKKIFLLCSAVILSISIIAKNIDKQCAENVALNFLAQISEKKSTINGSWDLSLVFTYKIEASDNKNNKDTNNILFYVFNVIEHDGFIIISGDDRVVPVIGYSTTSSFNFANIPPALQKLIENYKLQILSAQKQDLLATPEIEAQWQNLLNYVFKVPRSSTFVAPLLSTTWNQSPYYNDLCPYNYFYFQHTVTGCVATAMAQIMKYWNYPGHGTGFHSYNCPFYGTQSANFTATTYNWASMPNNVSSTNNAVATLMYHCGVSVDMDYGVEGSGAYVIFNNGQHPACAEVAYKTYFGYDPNTLQGLERADFSDAAWINLLKSDLNNGRPIQYAGASSGGGHTWVCDGYDANDFFHMNWGWGGQLDGYFTLDALNPSSSSFNSEQQAVIGIQPMSGGSNEPNIQLYSSISIDPDPIDFYNSFTINADFFNAGSTNFNGDYCAVIFDSYGVFIDYVEILTTGSNPLPPGYHYMDGITFFNDGLPTVPGTYIIAVYFRTTGGEWNLATSTSYNNPVYASINSPYNPLEQYSSIVATPSTFIQGSPASVNVNFYNTNWYTYYGQFKAALYDLEGNFVQTIGVYNETDGLPSGYVYSAPYITFNCPSITASPGTYMLAILEKETGSTNTYFVGGTYYTTPINIIVIPPMLSPDSFEPNDTLANAYTLPLSWNNDYAQCLTSGSNNHTGNDFDFYQINLPGGYKYIITARVHDSYNSGNGTVYSNDVGWSYNIGNGWSTIYDDIMPGNIIVNGAGTIFFQVSPYFLGTTGTYLFDIKIQRTSTIGIDEKMDEMVRIFPNPASDILHISLNDYNGSIAPWRIVNNLGQTFLTGNISKRDQILDISNLPDGIYIFCLKIEDKKYEKKFVQKK